MNWTILEAWQYGRGAMTVSPIDGSIYIASNVGIDGDLSNPGVFVSRDFGTSWEFYSFGIEEDWVIAWDIAQDPISGAIFVCTEICDHPQPYDHLYSDHWIMELPGKTFLVIYPGTEYQFR